MNCRDYRGGLIELARGGMLADAEGRQLMAHLDQCPACARFLESQQALSVALDDLAAEEIPPAGQFAAAVMAEFDRVHQPARRPRLIILTRWAMAAGLAAAASIAIVALAHHTPERIVRQNPRTQAVLAPPVPAPVAIAPPPAVSQVHTALAQHTAKRKPPSETEQPFYPIPFTAPLAPGEWTRVERMRIPVAALNAMGFHLMMPDPSATVEADVLVSQDGRARAIRPISISSSD